MANFVSRLFFKKIFFQLQYILRERSCLHEIKSQNHLVILNLHRVSNEINLFYPSLHQNLFETLLKYIKKHFNVITFREIKGSNKSTKPNLILSFDDGFFDFKLGAMPILAKYNVKANLNIIPQCVETGLPVWDVMLGNILHSCPKERVNKISLPGFKMSLTNSNKGQFGLLLTKYLKKMQKKERMILWLKFEALAKEFNVQFTQMLSRDDVIEIAEVHEIGVHSYSHESMAIESESFFEDDFARCKLYFENNLRIPLDIYTFPSGSYKKSNINFLLRLGIDYILLVDEKFAKNNDCIFPRFTFYANSQSEVKLRAIGYHR